jgi:hypothetical protein
LLTLALFMFGLSGCRNRAPVAFTHWAPTNTRTSAQPNVASQKLIAAGYAVDQQANLSAKSDLKGKLAAPITTRTTFFPKQKAEARKVIGNYRSQALEASKELSAFNYSPTGLGMSPPYLSGLRLIGMSFIWDIEEAIGNHDYDKAIVACGSATRLGYAMMGGGAYEASLGSSFINDARLRIIPILHSLTGLQLGTLGSALQKSSANRPPMQVSIENERDNMLLGLQQAQDFFENNKLDRLRERLGVSAKDTVDMLESLEKDQEKGKAMFDYIGSDIQARTEWYLKQVRNPRKAGLPPKKDETKSKLMFYRYFGSSIENLVPMLQSTYCRTQLFILECYLKQKMKLQKPLPRSLSLFSKSAIIDPFTAEPFFYKAGQSSYLLYSAGEDGIDNGGATDSSFRFPDLMLEKPKN